MQKAHLQKFTISAKINYVLQDEHESNFVSSEKPLGTGHAVLCTKELIDGNFAVIYADDFYGRNTFVQKALKLHKLNSIGVLIGYILQNTLSGSGSVSRAVCELDVNGMFEKIMEKEKIVNEEESIVDQTSNEN